MNHNIFTTAKAVVATVEREHYDDVAIIMLNGKIADMLNIDAINADIHNLYAGKCLSSKVEILDQNTEEYENKVKAYMYPENPNAVEKLMKELSKSIHENV